MSLNFNRLLTYQDIIEELEQLSLDESCCMRYGGIQVAVNVFGGIDIIAWQCNMADVQNFDVKLPTVIKIRLNSENYIDSIELMANFKGSQGMACSYSYLNKKLQHILKGELFQSNNPKISDPNILCCRHTYELVYGAATFLENCNKLYENRNIYYVEEITKAFYKYKVMKCHNTIDFNGKIEHTKVTIDNIIGNICYNSDGKVDHASVITVNGFLWEGGSWKQIHGGRVIEAATYNQYSMKLMKVFSKYWMSCAKRLGIKTKFHFSHIWGPTFFGIISQAIGLVIFNNNYAYFQHCIYGIQRNEKDEPLCIGVSKDLYEMQKYFNDFSMNDL